MIPNLNFYDVYGYLIPGLIFAVLIWLPYGLIANKWPSTDWASALIAVVVGYVLGHIVQGLARNALPSKTINGRYPSDAFLDADDTTFSPTLKNRLRTHILELSGTDVRTDVNGSDVTPAIRAQRADGFRYCRDALLSSKTVSYAEQMQGMYTLTDGLVTAFLLAAAFTSGWVVAGQGMLRSVGLAVTAFGLIATLLVAVLGALDKATATTSARLMLAFFMLALVGAGYLLGIGRGSGLTQRSWFAAMVLAYLAAAFGCYSTYKYFTKMYAQTVYRAFSLYEKSTQDSESE